MRAGPLIVALGFALSLPAFAQNDPHPGGHPGTSGGRAAQGAAHPPGGGGHFHNPQGAWVGHPGWQGGAHHLGQWHGGHWWRGTYGGRFGSWWIVGPDWYWYPTQLGPVPDPYTPPGLAAGYWYWCDAYQQYYPDVGACPSGWRAVLPQ